MFLKWNQQCSLLRLHLCCLLVASPALPLAWCVLLLLMGRHQKRRGRNCSAAQKWRWRPSSSPPAARRRGRRRRAGLRRRLRPPTRPRQAAAAVLAGTARGGGGHRHGRRRQLRLHAGLRIRHRRRLRRRRGRVPQDQAATLRLPHPEGARPRPRRIRLQRGKLQSCLSIPTLLQASAFCDNLPAAFHQFCPDAFHRNSNTCLAMLSKFTSS